MEEILEESYTPTYQSRYLPFPNNPMKSGQEPNRTQPVSQ
jgi:hypothetical protein